MTETETVPDIVERLRVWPAAYGEDAMSSTYVGKMAKTAADEIEELRHRLEWQADKLSEQDDELQYSRSRLAQTPGLTVSFPRWWVQKCHDQLKNMGQLPTGPLGDWAFLFRDMLSDALAKSESPDTSPDRTTGEA